MPCLIGGTPLKSFAACIDAWLYADFAVFAGTPHNNRHLGVMISSQQSDQTLSLHIALHCHSILHYRRIHGACCISQAATRSLLLLELLQCTVHYGSLGHTLIAEHPPPPPPLELGRGDTSWESAVTLVAYSKPHPSTRLCRSFRAVL